MTIVDEIRKQIKANGGETKGVNTIVDGLKVLWKDESESTPAESTPAEGPED